MKNKGKSLFSDAPSGLIYDAQSLAQLSLVGKQHATHNKGSEIKNLSGKHQIDMMTG